MSLLTVQVLVNQAIEKVWDSFTQAEHVQHWNFASPDWHCPSASNQFVEGGEFHYIMAAKDASFEFDFWGTFDTIIQQQFLYITLGDGSKMEVFFEKQGNQTLVTENFEPETMNTHELQVMGWQSILNQFKKYVEGE